MAGIIRNGVKYVSNVMAESLLILVAPRDLCALAEAWLALIGERRER